MKHELDLSIIIVNWNVEEYLKQSLNSLFSHISGLRFEVIVVDNASDDKSVEMTLKEFPSVRLIENKTNHGFGRANNQGAKIAKGEWLLLLNPDTLLEDNLPAKMIRYSMSIGADIAGPRILQEDKSFYRGAAGNFINLRTAINQSFLLYRLFPSSSFFSGFYLSKDFSNIKKVDWVSGACMLLKKKVFDELDGFDSKYFLLSEDTDLCFRARQKKLSVQYIPKTSVIHFEGRSISKQDDGVLEKNCVSYRQIVFDQNGKIKAYIMTLILQVGYYFRIMMFALRYSIKKDSTSLHKLEVAQKYRRLLFGDNVDNRN